MLIVGEGAVVNVNCAVEVHPPELPVTEYTVVAEGDETIEELVPPVFQVYDEAPEAVNVAGFVAHTVVGPAINTVGVTPTVIA